MNQNHCFKDDCYPPLNTCVCKCSKCNQDSFDRLEKFVEELSVLCEKYGLTIGATDCDTPAILNTKTGEIVWAKYCMTFPVQARTGTKTKMF